MKAKTLLIIPMAIIELLLLAANWIVAVINPRIGERFMLWNMKTLPDKDWYS